MRTPGKRSGDLRLVLAATREAARPARAFGRKESGRLATPRGMLEAWEGQQMTDQAGGKKRPRVAVTMGDPAGIGPELCLRILQDPVVLRHCIPVIFGQEAVLRRVSTLCRLPAPLTVIGQSEWNNGEAPGEGGVVDCAGLDADQVEPGRVSAACGKAAYRYLEAAIQAALAGRVAAIATAPLHKEALRLAGIPHPGHTEILTALTGARRSCMMLLSDDLRISFVTLHVGYAQVPQLLSRERILEVIELTAQTLARLQISSPNIGVCGLNPHAGEQGLFGDREEERHIRPALEEARARGIGVEGPLPPDTVFVPERRKAFSAIVCMYHDQGHIPFKMLNFDTGVNVTLGLPIVRTSVDHGTAFDIAWTGRARWTSLVQAILWATRLAGTSPP